MLVDDHDEKPCIFPSVSAIRSLSLGVELLVVATRFLSSLQGATVLFFASTVILGRWAWRMRLAQIGR
ncbi:hypothetical protein [Variovorax sp. ZS18.2.2]|uniref:hypothetical protein n=1 Tax=Variovorax sp. ZS18.2.2 TaxID=2971255 RepID=UPI0021510F2B|nr:hypothetical protein [Variovorax sp. ZS18.2.2]